MGACEVSLDSCINVLNARLPFVILDSVLGLNASPLKKTSRLLWSLYLVSSRYSLMTC